MGMFDYLTVRNLEHPNLKPDHKCIYHCQIHETKLIEGHVDYEIIDGKLMQMSAGGFGRSFEGPHIVDFTDELWTEDYVFVFDRGILTEVYSWSAYDTVCVKGVHDLGYRHSDGMVFQAPHLNENSNYLQYEIVDGKLMQITESGEWGSTKKLEEPRLLRFTGELYIFSDYSSYESVRYRLEFDNGVLKSIEEH
ncbi:hypothetical protein P3547_19825 [Vibrio parahaemolyticus]|nr:hypothetical protein [Vibrio parahaemolyticus]